MPPSNDYSSEDSKSSGDIDTSLVNAFAEFGTSEGLSQAVDDFVVSNCSDFEGASLSDEQNLEWTSLHHSFVSLVERHLESFCKEHDTTAEDVFLQLQAVRESTIAEEFVPLVIKMCEYDFFLRNMKEAAENGVARKKAAAKQAEGGGGNLSGAYVIDVGRIDGKELEAYFQYIQIPWFFRKVMLQATKRISEMVLHHDDEEQLVFKYTLPFFGRDTKEYKLDGELRTKTNAIGKTQNVRCFQEKGTVRICNEGPKFEPRGTATSTFSLECPPGSDEEMLLWKRVVRDEDGNQTAVLPLWFSKVPITTDSRK
jgi:hypothetical protein